MRRLVCSLWLAFPGLALAQGPAPEDSAASHDVAADAAPPRSETTPRLCQNGVDDDADGAIDCDDDECRMLIFCVSRVHAEDTAARCANDEDDDGDGALDCADPECRAFCRTDDRRPGAPGSIYQPRSVEARPELGTLEHDDPRRYPARWAARPMTYLEGMLVPRLGLSVRDVRGDDPLVQLGLGLSYGIVDRWQVTIVPVPLRLAPSFDFENPALSTTVRFFEHELVELGLYANVSIPVGTAEGLGVPEPLPTHHLLARSRYSDGTHLDLALLVRLHLGAWVRIDLDLPVTTVVFTAPDEARADLTFDARVGVSPIDYLTLGVYGGAVVPGPSYDGPKVPFGFFLGASVPGSRRGPVLDLMARFGWPLFFDADVGDVEADFWQLTFDARIYTYLLP